MSAVVRRGALVVLIGLPLGLAVLGPLFVPDELPERSRPFTATGPLGTDFVGRDTAEQVLLGGGPIVLTALGATLVCYLVAVPLGTAAAMAGRRWLDEVLMRPLDLLLAVPSLLVMLLAATIAPPGPATVVGVVALVNVPDAARTCRAAALEVARRPAVEAMRSQGESWWRITVGYVGRCVLRTLAADAGTRLVGAFYLVAAASFLGIAVSPDAGDWAVMVDVNRGGLFLLPWPVLVPAALLICLSLGLNLLFDGLLARRSQRELTH